MDHICHLRLWTDAAANLTRIGAIPLSAGQLAVALTRLAELGVPLLHSAGVCAHGASTGQLDALELVLFVEHAHVSKVAAVLRALGLEWRQPDTAGEEAAKHDDRGRLLQAIAQSTVHAATMAGWAHLNGAFLPKSLLELGATRCDGAGDATAAAPDAAQVEPSAPIPRSSDLVFVRFAPIAVTPDGQIDVAVRVTVR